MEIGQFLGVARRVESELAAALRTIAEAHSDEPDVFHLCRTLAGQSDDHVARLEEFIDRYCEGPPDEARLRSALFTAPRNNGLRLVRDLMELYLMTCEGDVTWMVLRQAAQAARDAELLAFVTECQSDTATQMKWLKTRLKQAAPQALVVA